MERELEDEDEDGERRKIEDENQNREMKRGGSGVACGIVCELRGRMVKKVRLRGEKS